MQKAFTLIELLVVVLIIGILASVALPQYQKSVAKARATQLIIASKAIATEQNTYLMSNGIYTEQADELSSYPKDSATSLKVGKDSCSLIYSNQAGSQRVSCSMSKPNIVIQRYYKTNVLNCCTYSSDNFKGDDVCKNLLHKTTWYNGCSSGGEGSMCHCYNGQI